MKTTYLTLLALSFAFNACTRRDASQVEPGAAKQQKETNSDESQVQPGDQNQGGNTDITGPALPGTLVFQTISGKQVKVAWDGTDDLVQIANSNLKIE